MKCPIPREGKSSPTFQEVSPSTVPLHSFFQIFFPIAAASAWERVIPDAPGVEPAGVSTETQLTSRMKQSREIRGKIRGISKLPLIKIKINSLKKLFL